MWCGFAIPVILHGLKGLHLYLPSTPNPTALFLDRPILYRKTVLCLGMVALGEPLYLPFRHRSCLSAHA